jgi:hypothetical protein
MPASFFSVDRVYESYNTKIMDFLIEYDPCDAGQMWDELVETGLIGEMFVPQYLAQSSVFRSVSVPTVNDTFMETIPLEYTSQQRAALFDSYEKRRKWAISGPRTIPDEESVIRSNLVKGEEYSQELRMTRCTLPEITKEVRELLATAETEARRKGLPVAVEVWGSTLLTFPRNGRVETDYVLRLEVLSDPQWFVWPMNFHVDSSSDGKRQPWRATVSLGAGPWLASGRDASDVWHECQIQNWKRLFRHFQRLAELKSLKKRLLSWLREYRWRLRGLGIERAFSSLPMPTEKL